MQSFIGESPRGIQNPAQGLVHGLFIGKGFRDFRFQRDDIGPFEAALDTWPGRRLSSRQSHTRAASRHSHFDQFSS